jgi:hypothetical protein
MTTQEENRLRDLQVFIVNEGGRLGQGEFVLRTLALDFKRLNKGDLETGVTLGWGSFPTSTQRWVNCSTTLRDLAGYIEWARTEGKAPQGRPIVSFMEVLVTLAHDVGGTLRNEPCFCPRSSGYASFHPFSKMRG